jgi:hypothetical protein
VGGVAFHLTAAGNDTNQGTLLHDASSEPESVVFLSTGDGLLFLPRTGYGKRKKRHLSI